MIDKPRCGSPVIGCFVKEIKNPPMSSRWNFRGVVRGYEVWASNSGKRYYKHIETGRWFKMEKADAKP